MFWPTGQTPGPARIRNVISIIPLTVKQPLNYETKQRHDPGVTFQALLSV